MIMELQEAASQAATQAVESEVTWSAVTAWATSKFIQWAKKRKSIPVLSTDEGAERANRLVSWGAAALVSFGIAFTFDSSTGQFAITGSVAGLLSGLAHMVRQVMFQEIAYKKFIKG